MNSEYSLDFPADPSLKDDIQKIQMEITKLNKKFEKEIASWENKEHINTKKNLNAPTEKKSKKPFIVANPQSSNFLKKNLGNSITPKVFFLFFHNMKKKKGD